MKPDEFWCSCLEDTLLMVVAYENRKNEQWQHTRVLAYTTYSSVTNKDERVSLYEFMPLKGDPIPDELQEPKNMQVEEMRAALKEYNQQLRETKNRMKAAN